MKVFLDGTYSSWNWRNELCSLLKCDYYNPTVKEFSIEKRVMDVKEKQASDYILFGITNEMKDTYLLAEIENYSNICPEKVLILDLYKNNNDIFTNHMSRMIKAVEKMSEAKGVRIFNSIEDIAYFLNSEQLKENLDEYSPEYIGYDA